MIPCSYDYRFHTKVLDTPFREGMKSGKISNESIYEKAGKNCLPQLYENGDEAISRLVDDSGCLNFINSKVSRFHVALEIISEKRRRFEYVVFENGNSD